MSTTDIKPLNWQPAPGVGYTVTRRPDGGMHFVFRDLDKKTLQHWREFSLQHLLDSDRLTRNLYDLRQVRDWPQGAVQYALEVKQDPSVRNIRLAVVVASEAVRQAIEEIAATTSAPGGVDLAIFTDVDEAEAWLARPLTQLV